MFPIDQIQRFFLRRRPFPTPWLEILKQRVPFFSKLHPSLRQGFLDDVKIFAWQKYFEGAQGFVITDEVKVVIAASAARLVLFRDISYFDRLSEIVVYPDAYQHSNSSAVIFGEAHSWGVVVLSWASVLHGLANPHDGHDTASHEFAHVLDRNTGAFDGTPELDSMGAYGNWAKVMQRHFIKLRSGHAKMHKVMRDYGETNEAEFFAVATESFFEKPQQMLKHSPELYAAMQSFYGGDPAAALRGFDDDKNPWSEVAPNSPCPCGSDKKYKRCCGGH